METRQTHERFIYNLRMIQSSLQAFIDLYGDEPEEYEDLKTFANGYKERN